MALDEPSAQLHLEIRDSIQAALSQRRPLLHHLNDDTSWFLQLPRPLKEIKKGSRFYYNILIDPWLAGGQSDVASWFSQQFHVHESAVPSISALEILARETEALATGLQYLPSEKSSQANINGYNNAGSFIDALAVSHEFTDHCHKDTLVEVDSSVPVFAIKEAANLISGWKHFDTVITVDSFGHNGNTDWRTTTKPPLPDWIGISRLLQTDDVLNYHSALMLTFNNTRSSFSGKFAKKQSETSTKHNRKSSVQHDQLEESAEAIVYTPHGMNSGDLNLIPNANPPIHTLAFLHGLHNVRVGTVSGRTALQSNLGAHNGLKAQRLLNAKHWIGTHDEVKKGGGLVSFFLQRQVISLQEALEEEKRAQLQGKHIEDEELLDAFEGTNWVDLRNGESRILV